MRAKLATFLIFLAVMVSGAYLLSGVVLTAISEKVIDYFVANVDIPNVKYTRPVFGSVGFSGPKAITWSDITADATIVRDEVLRKTEKISVKVDKFTIAMEGPPKRAFLFRIKGLSADVVRKTAGVTSPGSQNATNRVEGGDLQLSIKFDVMTRTGIRAKMDDLSRELKRFFKEGITKIPIQFSGDQKFILKGKPYTMMVRVEQENGEYRLVMDEESLEQFGNAISGISVTEGDRSVLARNPLRMPQLLRLRDKAETMASLAREKDPAIPEDAYRHVLWSYLLTKAYGEGFAKEVGDAHESGLDSEEAKEKGRKKLRAAQYQDFNNNAVGRSYALKGYPESNILHLVQTDPDVIRDKDIKKRYDPVRFAKYKKEIGRSEGASK